jgi:hypothetical protein
VSPGGCEERVTSGAPTFCSVVVLAGLTATGGGGARPPEAAPVEAGVGEVGGLDDSETTGAVVADGGRGGGARVCAGGAVKGTIVSVECVRGGLTGAPSFGGMGADRVGGICGKR